MKRMLVVSEKYWPGGGGAELATHQILGLLREDFDITVLTGTKQPARHSNVRYLYTRLLDAGNKVFLWKNLVALSNARWCVELMKAADVLYIPRVSYPMVSAAKSRGKRVVVHLHDYQPIRFSSIYFVGQNERGKLHLLGSIRDTLKFELMENGGVLRKIASVLASPMNFLGGRLIRKADIIICASQRQAEIIGKHLPEIRLRIRVIPNPPPHVPLRRLRSREPNLLFVGGHSRVKGWDTLIESARMLLRKRSTKITIVGIESDKIRGLDSLAASLGDSFVLRGKVSHTDLLNLIESCSAVIVPSLSEEPLPTIVVESMLSGTIPIASRAGGIPEIVSGTFAERFSFEPGDSRELFERMEEVILMSEGERLGAGRGLREEALKKFDASELKRKYLQTFSESTGQNA